MQRLDDWRLRIYIGAFLVALGAFGLVEGVPPSLVASIAIGLGIALLVLRALTGRPYGTGFAVWLILLPTLVMPLGLALVTSGAPIADTVRSATVWPQFLLCLLGSRVLSVSNEAAFAELWRKPFAKVGAVEEQSVGSALAVGIAAALAFYALVPALIPAATGQPTGILLSAMKGSTLVHGAIILMFLTILAMIVDGLRLHLRDISVLNRFRTAVRQSGAGPNALLTAEFQAVGHTRASRMIAAALRPSPENSAVSAYESFHTASRRFLRALLPFLPLLGFLGTVIGLATAISDLPRGLAPAPGQPLDISGSLAGLAIKFETTLLGILASLIATLALNLLEKHEAELAAACQRVVEAIRYAEADDLLGAASDAQG